MAEKMSTTPVPAYEQQAPPQGYQSPDQPPPPGSEVKIAPAYGEYPLPPNGVGQPSPYPVATPLHALQKQSTVVDCPVCGQREMTRTEAVTGKTTHAWAAVICCCFCLGCIPYLVTALKDVNHHCGKCDELLATWHNSGHLVIHQNQRPA